MPHQYKTISITTHCEKRRRLLYENTDIGYKLLSQRKHFWNPISSDNFKRVNKIGEGTYGAVYRSKAPSGKYVALKKIRMDDEKEGFPITAIREVKILRALNHPNIVPLLDVVALNGSGDAWDTKRTKPSQKQDLSEIYMVFEYLDHDLAGIISSHEVTLQEKHIKYYIQMILKGLFYIHETCGIIHRDIKGSNILINNNGEVKIADFGLSRPFHPNENRIYTNRVVTLWYRAPELLLGEKRYTSAIDLWSLGCVFAELIFGKPTFPGNSEMQQLTLICKLVGSPNEQNFEGCSKFPIRLSKVYPRALSQRYAKLKRQSPLAFDLLDKLLVLDPKKRLTASQALEHKYFDSEPFPERANLDVIQPSHDYETRIRKENARKSGSQYN